MRETAERPAGAGRYRRWVGIGIVTMLLLALVPALAASGAEGDLDIVIPVDTVIHAPVGSTTILTSIATPAEFVGATCTVSVTTENQSSVHPNNDLSIESATSVTVPDVESVPGGTLTAADDIVLSDTIVISLIMGPDHTFSAGVEVGFDCPEVGSGSTTTTTIDETTTTSLDETTTTADVGGTQVTSTTVEVLGTVVTTAGDAEVGSAGALPFTGANAGQLALVGASLLLLGALVLLSGREPAATGGS